MYVHGQHHLGGHFRSNRNNPKPNLIEAVRSIHNEGFGPLTAFPISVGFESISHVVIMQSRLHYERKVNLFRVHFGETQHPSVRIDIDCQILTLV